ncbi:hypothetical protein [uncultured Roseovarius sp.]|uniref:hypothetical protein n=1 Tax=uncultured Roseovarius sp. TaxID=293344 RepID=UPI0026060AAA|nr:hypothetical protein [uncultured Roseovarius sp.]
MHGHTAPRPSISNPIAARIADLSDEYLTASEGRREEIGEEISGLIAGRIIPIRQS